jgi:group I intron endonuclease
MSRKCLEESCNKKNNGWIYIFINKINNKKYIGQTWNIEKRIKEHINGNGYAKLLKNAISKYGIHYFNIIKYCKVNTQEELDNLEINLISMFNTLAPNGYNIALGGSHGKHSEETKKLIGSYHKNKNVSIETRDKQSAKHIGKKITQDTKYKISSKIKKSYEIKDKPVYFFNCFNHNLVIEFKNISEIKKNINIPITRIYGSISAKSKFKYNNIYCYARYINDPLNKKFGSSIKIIQNDGTELLFNSIKEAENKLNIKRNIISNILNNKQKQSKYLKNNQTIFFTAKYI